MTNRDGHADFAASVEARKRHLIAMLGDGRLGHIHSKHAPRGVV
jgi:hypothetical protein